MKPVIDPSNRNMKRFATIVIPCLLALVTSAQTQPGDEQQASKKQRQKERVAAQEAQPGANPRAQRTVARATTDPRAYPPGVVNSRAERRIPPARVTKQEGDQIPQNPPAALDTVAANGPVPTPAALKTNRRDRGVLAAPGEKPDVQKIRARHANFHAQP